MTSAGLTNLLDCKLCLKQGPICNYRFLLRTTSQPNYPGRVAGRECLIEFPNLAHRSCSHSLNPISEPIALRRAFVVYYWYWFSMELPKILSRSSLRARPTILKYTATLSSMIVAILSRFYHRSQKERHNMYGNAIHIHRVLTLGLRNNDVGFCRTS